MAFFLFLFFILFILPDGFTIFAVIKGTAATEIVSEIDKRIKSNTQFIKSVTADIESLINRAKSDEEKSACKKVFKAVRFSDTVSRKSLSVIEAKITVNFDELSIAVSLDDAETIKEYADEIVLLIKECNAKCKA